MKAYKVTSLVAMDPPTLVTFYVVVTNPDLACQISKENFLRQMSKRLYNKYVKVKSVQEVTLVENTDTQESRW